MPGLVKKHVRRLAGVIFRAVVLATIAMVAEAPGLRHTLTVPETTTADAGIDLASTLRTAKSGKPYLTIDITAGRIYLRTIDSVLLAARCSAGSGATLRDSATGRVWSFATPGGIFPVRAKAKNPIWRKPDWAYLEEGLPIPQNRDERLTEDELGEYSLDLGQGLYIHGTLYTRLLGMNVTHGCIRVGDEALAQIYHAVEIGTPVFIFNAGDGADPEANFRQSLEFDYSSRIIRYCMNDWVVWEAPFAVETPLFTQSSGTVKARHVYAGRGEYAAYELATVAEELGIPPDDLQRCYPGRMALMLADGSVLEITTNIHTSKSTNWRNVCFDLLRLIDVPWAEHQRRLSMSATDALTLFVLAQPGSMIHADRHLP